MLLRTCYMFFMCVLLAMPVQLFAQQYALLVGVSAYPALDKNLQLHGPQNDVVLAKKVLKDVGFADENIRIVANGVKDAQGEPTRQGILNELDALAKEAQRGDFVYLQFGGHGSQQPSRPDKPAKEPDGLDEIFLPVDVGQWDDSIGSVKNSIRDDELGVKFDAIRERGAFVWAVFDACHSGNITRGGGDPETRQRRADPWALGIPQKAMDLAQADRVLTRGAPAPQESALGSAGKAGGGYVYFYAAQTTETTPESRFPAGDPERQPYGVFTYTLAQVIQSNPGISYRQAGERVLQIYAARNLRVTPLFEGSAIDAPIFGQKIGDVVRQWQVTQEPGGMTIKAGSLQQLDTGAIFAVYPDAAAKTDAEPAGYLRADKVEVMQSRVSPVAYNGKPASFSIPNDAVVRLVNPNINFNLRVALPPAIPKGDAYALAHKVIDKLHKGGSDGLKLEWVDANKPADVRLILSDDRKQLNDQPHGEAQLWLVSSDGAWEKTGDAKTPSIKLDKSEQELFSVLAGELQLIAKAINLIRIAATGGGGLASSAKVETKFYVSHGQEGKREEVSPASVPVLEKGDKLQLSVRNLSVKPMDITVLGVDARYGVALLYPSTSNDVNRIHPRDTLTIPGEGQGEIILDGSTVGRESILVIAVEAEPNSTTANLGFLEQPSLPSTRGVRGHSPDPVEDLFEYAGFGKGGASTRGAVVNRGVAAQKTTIKVYQYRASGERQ